MFQKQKKNPSKNNRNYKIPKFIVKYLSFLFVVVFAPKGEQHVLQKNGLLQKRQQKELVGFVVCCLAAMPVSSRIVLSFGGSSIFRRTTKL